MREDIYHFYFNTLGVWNLVYSRYNLWYLFLLIALSFISMVGIIISLILTYLIPTFSFILLFILVSILLNKKNREILSRKIVFENNIVWEGVNYSRFSMWNGKLFYKTKENTFNQYLDYRLAKKDDLDNLIKVLKNELSYLKYYEFIVPGISFAMFIILWNKLVDKVLAVTSNLDFSIYFILLSILLCFFVLVISFFQQFNKEFFNREASKTRELILLIERKTLDGINKTNISV